MASETEEAEMRALRRTGMFATLAATAAVAAGGCGREEEMDPRTAAAEAERPKVLATLEVKDLAGDVLEAAGSVWVSAHRTGYLLRVDPRTAEVRSRTRVARSATGIVGADRDGIWAYDNDRSAYTHVDAETGRVDRRVPLDGDLHLLHGRFFVLTPNGIREVNVHGRTLGRFEGRDLEPGPVAGAGGRVWHAAEGRITGWDPDTGRRVATVKLADDECVHSRSGCEMIAAGDALWLSTESGEVLKIDARAARVVSRTRVGSEAGRLAELDGRILVAGRGRTVLDNQVAVVDARTARLVGTIPAGDVPLSFVAAAAGRAWVADQSGRIKVIEL